MMATKKAVEALRTLFEEREREEQEYKNKGKKKLLALLARLDAAHYGMDRALFRMYQATAGTHTHHKAVERYEFHEAQYSERFAHLKQAIEGEIE
jgi:hypothetical protein